MVLFGPIADAASEKLATELPEEFVVASEYNLIDLNIYIYNKTNNK